MCAPSLPLLMCLPMNLALCLRSAAEHQLSCGLRRSPVKAYPSKCRGVKDCPASSAADSHTKLRAFKGKFSLHAGVAMSLQTSST